MTNALITEKTANAITKASPRIVQFSIDGDEEVHEVHDYIRGVKGTYQRALRGIELLKSAIDDIGESSTEIRLNCVILPQNVHCLNSVAELARDLAIRLQFQYLMWLDHERISAHELFLEETLGFNDRIICNLYNNFDGLDLILLNDQIAKVTKFCNKIGVPLFFMQFSDQDMIKGWYSDLNFIPRRKCVEAFLVSRISVEGNVKFCPLIDYSCGNIRDDQFSTVWKNDRAHKIRSELRKNGLFPGCARCCKL